MAGCFSGRTSSTTTPGTRRARSATNGAATSLTEPGPVAGDHDPAWLVDRGSSLPGHRPRSCHQARRSGLPPRWSSPDTVRATRLSTKTEPVAEVHMDDEQIRVILRNETGLPWQSRALSTPSLIRRRSTVRPQRERPRTVTGEHGLGDRSRPFLPSRPVRARPAWRGRRPESSWPGLRPPGRRSTPARPRTTGGAPPGRGRRGRRSRTGRTRPAPTGPSPLRSPARRNRAHRRKVGNVDRGHHRNAGWQQLSSVFPALACPVGIGVGESPRPAQRPVAER